LDFPKSENLKKRLVKKAEETGEIESLFPFRCLFRKYIFAIMFFIEKFCEENF